MILFCLILLPHKFLGVLVEHNVDSQTSLRNTALGAQDERQAIDVPGLPSVREMLLNGKPDEIADEMWPTSRVAMDLEGGVRVPTPITVANIGHWINFDKKGTYYGNALQAVQTTDQVQAMLKTVDMMKKPNLVNILAIVAQKAPTYRKGDTPPLYKLEDIQSAFHRLYASFLMAKMEAQRISPDRDVIDVNSGNLGCGAFGGSLELMWTLHGLVAKAVGVNLVLHVVKEKLTPAALTGYVEALWPSNEPTIKTSVLLTRVLAKGFTWGIGTGE